jgi:DNA repair protein RecO (recombination protein O)
MLHKTRGIALSYVKYRETSIIVRIFTRQFGIQSYIVNGVRSKSAKTKIALFQPLTLLDLVVYHNKRKEINRISEIKPACIFHSIPFEVKKMAISLFITELLGQILKEEVEQEQLYDFLHTAIMNFDMKADNYEHFHLWLMLRLTRYLGILPESAGSIIGYSRQAGHHSAQFVGMLDTLIHADLDSPITMGRVDRNELMNVLIQYYQSHYDSIQDFRSVPVLKEVFS